MFGSALRYTFDNRNRDGYDQIWAAYMPETERFIIENNLPRMLYPPEKTQCIGEASKECTKIWQVTLTRWTGRPASINC